MSITEDFATQWDYPLATKVVIPSKDRDFSRPKQPFFHSTTPLEDDNMTTDSQNLKVVNLQKYLKKSPFGISYQGPINGVITDELLNAVELLENKISKRLGYSIPSFVFGDKIIFENIDKVKEFAKESPKFNPNVPLPSRSQKSRKDFYQEKLSEPLSQSTSETPMVSSRPTSSQSSKPRNKKEVIRDMLGIAGQVSSEDSSEEKFNSPQEISNLEKLFQLPVTGQVSPELIQKLKDKETEIARLTDDYSVINTIWNSKNQKILATANDIQLTDKFVQQLLELKKSKSNS